MRSKELWDWAEQLDEEVAKGVERLRQGDIGDVPFNYPEFAKAGYKRILVHEYWNLLYIVIGSSIRIRALIDCREDYKKYTYIIKGKSRKR